LLIAVFSTDIHSVSEHVVALMQARLLVAVDAVVSYSSPTQTVCALQWRLLVLVSCTSSHSVDVHLASLVHARSACEPGAALMYSVA